MKLTDADNAADGIFFPALEQNMMGAVLINENDEVMFFNPAAGNDSNLLIVFYVQIMPDDFVMQLHRF